jgi:sugar (pentulose or hexulose) kinase
VFGLLNGVMGQLDIVVTKTHLSARGDSIDIEVPWKGFEVLTATIADLQQLVAQHDVSRVSVTSDQLGVVFLDGHGRPVTDVLWADDERSADDAAWCNKKLPEQWWIEHIGETPQTHHGLTKMSWLHRSEPDVWTEIAHVCGIDDHVRQLLIDPS